MSSSGGRSGSDRPRGRGSSGGSGRGGSSSGGSKGGGSKSGGWKGGGGSKSGKGPRGAGGGASGGRRSGGPASSAGKGRPTKSGGGRSGGKKRIPPPPPQGEGQQGRDSGAGREPRSEVVYERADDEATGKSSGKGGRSRRRSGRGQVDVEAIDFPGVAPATAAKLRNRLAESAGAFEAERFTEAAKLLASIEKLSPGVPEVHELAGLTQYRLGHWVRALGELERFAELTGSVEQHPVMADCCRALNRWARAEELWHELGESSPTPELIEEGRIVQAGALADRGRLDDAIRFMERAPDVKSKPGVHHLRRWYMLADLYERAGDNARARRLFGDIVRVDPVFGDAAERASSL